MVDLLIGGSPCQGFSVAGKKLNFNDSRSKLFFKYVEALNILKPKYFIFENVMMKRENISIISSYLGVNPVKINSSLVSAQNRVRLYWINLPVQQPEDKHIYLQDILESGVCDRLKSYCIDANYFKGTNLKMYLEKRRRQIVKDVIFRKLTPLECERLQTLPDNYTAVGVIDGKEIPISNTQRYKMLGNGWTVDVIAHILSFIPETHLNTVVSLFDGISCGQLALIRAGKQYSKYYASEVDKYAISITQKHFPETIQIGDVAKIDWESFLAKINNNYHLTWKE